MDKDLKIGDHVEWNSPEGIIKGAVEKILIADVEFNGRTFHASEQEPQYVVKSSKTGKLALHKGTALKKIY